MKIAYTKRAEKDLKALNEPIKSRIQQAIERLPGGTIIKLSGYKSHYRLRVGNYRVVFVQINDDELMVTTVAPRGQVYKGV